jgi:hypothetical protein
MNAIIPHTFRTGLGDCVVNIYQYIDYSRKLKEIGYKLHLKINVAQNKYYKNLNFFDLFDESTFNIFDSIEYIDSPVTSIPGYIVKKITRNSTEIFLDKDCDIPTTSFIQQGTIFHEDRKPSWVLPFSKVIYDMYNSLNLGDYNAIHFRSHDGDESLGLYEKHTQKITEICNAGKPILVCSNNYTLKNKLRENGNVITIDIPGEVNAGNHCNNQLKKFDNETNKQRTLMALLEMLTLSRSNKLYSISEYRRVSQFLFYPFTTSTPIEYL